MAANKSQHFVPKSLLQNFGTDNDLPPNERKQISMANIARQKIVRNASIRDQCAKSYLYGKDLTLEKNLSVMEGVFGNIVRDITDTKKLLRDYNPRATIALMISVQKNRTSVAEEEINDQFEKFLKLAAYGRIDSSELEKIKIRITNAAGGNVQTAILANPIIYDLRQLLLVNLTDLPFIISDNPVCMTNWYFSTRLNNFGVGGIGTAGIQLIMPLSPGHAILLHDDNIYSTRSSDNVIRITKQSDVNHINRLQFLNSYKNIYFNNSTTDVIANGLITSPRPERISSFKRMDKVLDSNSFVPTDKNELDPPTSGVTSELVVLSSFKLSEHLNISDIKIRQKPQYHYDGSMAGPLRDKVWRDIIKEFTDAVRAKVYKASDLWEFVARHPERKKVGKWVERLHEYGATF